MDLKERFEARAGCTDKSPNSRIAPFIRFVLADAHMLRHQSADHIDIRMRKLQPTHKLPCQQRPGVLMSVEVDPPVGSYRTCRRFTAVVKQDREAKKQRGVRVVGDQ